jgi:hypothetical protein
MQAFGNIDFNNSYSPRRNSFWPSPSIKKYIPPAKQVNPNPQDNLTEAVNEGVKEGEKDVLREDRKNTEKYENLVKTSDKVLYKLSTVFPFDFFPDDIVIDINQVNLIIRSFFLTERRHSVKIADITDVFIDTSLFFSTLHIIDVGFKENVIEVSFLKNSEAKKARRIIQGLCVAAKQGIDLTKIDDHNLLGKIEELGKIEVEGSG